MSGHLCLKWNNHSTAFLKSICNIQIKEKYCDATIACQGKYFPVHRVILSTCSDYFEEMFERMQCQHPYIVFKDIEPQEMELLLNYMYQGEVNVVQERLPTLIKAAEALRIKGLAVPDDLPSGKESKKRSSHNDDDVPHPKRRSEEKRRRRNSSENGARLNSGNQRMGLEEDELKVIKEEPIDPSDYEGTSLPNSYNDELPGDSTLPLLAPEEEQSGINKEESVFVNFPLQGETSTTYIKTEDDMQPPDNYENQSTSWTDFQEPNAMSNMSTDPQTSRQDDMYESQRRLETFGSTPGFASGTAQGNAAFKRGGHCSKRCPYCSYTSDYGWSHLKRHIMFKHTGERPFHCSMCPKRFASKVNLLMHTRIHTGEKPFQCPNCNKRFTLKGNLTKHLMRKSKCARPN